MPLTSSHPTSLAPSSQYRTSSKQTSPSNFPNYSATGCFLLKTQESRKSHNVLAILNPSSSIKSPSTPTSTSALPQTHSTPTGCSSPQQGPLRRAWWAAVGGKRSLVQVRWVCYFPSPFTPFLKSHAKRQQQQQQQQNSSIKDLQKSRYAPKKTPPTSK